MSTTRAAAVALCLATLAPSAAAGQDTLRLGYLHRAAREGDPRLAQLGLLESVTALRLSTLSTERRPQLALNGNAVHQSDVTQVSLNLPGASPPVPPRDRWQATLDVQQLLLDGGTVAARRGVERARLAESSAAVEAALYRLSIEVNAAFFAAHLQQERTREFDALLVDLDARLAVARARVVNGTALPRDTSAILAERLRAVSARAEASASLAASLAVLARFARRQVQPDVVLALPELAGPVNAARASMRERLPQQRPEFAHFERTRERLDREVALTAVENRPRISAFGQAGLGRPGLNQFRTDPDEFWQAGLRVEWRPLTWGSAGRSAEVLRLQQRVVATEERAFADQLARAVETDVADMDRLAVTLETDRQVVGLRMDIERQARAQFTEGAITAAEYVETRTDVLEANLALQRHRAELAYAQARYLTTLGLVSGALQPAAR